MPMPTFYMKAQINTTPFLWAGHDTALPNAKQLLEEWEVKFSAHFPDYKDWNEELQASKGLMQEEQMEAAIQMNGLAM